MKLILNSKLLYLFPKEVNAFTLGSQVHIRKGVIPTPVLVNHERIHVDQIKKLGAIRFYFDYIFQYVIGRIKGLSHDSSYMNISYEAEAYHNQHDKGYTI